MKKIRSILSVLLTALLVCACLVPAGAAVEIEASPLQVHEDGSFKICMFNDLQDKRNPNANTMAMVEAILDSEQPDLVVIAGDSISDTYFTASADDIDATIKALMKPIADRNIPYLFTFGNHDHDAADALDLEGQIASYKSYASCIIPDDGCDPGTYNVPVLNSDGTGYAFNVYMMDTGNKNEEVGGYRGVTPEQVEWYKAKSDELKAANGGEVVPSMVFQHIPVKEIYQFMEETDDIQNAYFSIDDYKWYRLKEDRLVGENNYCFEAPCSEKQTVTTGQYEAWLEKGDIIGAFFGHDHINNFVGITEEGIKMGYNAGSGFATYGEGGNRSARIFVLNEEDPAAYETYNVTYNDIMEEDINFVMMDLFSLKTITLIMRVLYPAIGWIFELFA